MCYGRRAGGAARTGADEQLPSEEEFLDSIRKKAAAICRT